MNFFENFGYFYYCTPTVDIYGHPLLSVLSISSCAYLKTAILSLAFYKG